jgi:hypothetical protein
MAACHQKEKGRLLNRWARVPPTLFTALNRPQRDADQVSEFGLALANLPTDVFEIDVESPDHCGSRIRTSCTLPSTPLRLCHIVTRPVRAQGQKHIDCDKTDEERV